LRGRKRDRTLQDNLRLCVDVCGQLVGLNYGDDLPRCGSSCLRWLVVDLWRFEHTFICVTYDACLSPFRRGSLTRSGL
jgi:hypothetical protein